MAANVRRSAGPHRARLDGSRLRRGGCGRSFGARSPRRHGAARRAANEQITKRQEAELAAATGQSRPGEVAESGRDYIADRLSELREAVEARRDGGGEELAVVDRREDPTPGRG